jgi:CheY-like chemotaxis protein
MNIWIIEDNPATRMLMQALVNTGVADRHTLTVCASAEEALQKLEGAPLPDVFLVDLDLPGISGLDFCREIRTRTAGQSEYLPYLMIVTANEGAEVLNNVLDAGANDYLAKPVHARVLQTRLRVAQKLLQHAAVTAEADYFKALAAFSLNRAHVAMAILEAGELRVSFANEAMLELLNGSAEAVLGHRLSAMQDWTEELAAALAKALAQNEPFHAKLASRSAYVTNRGLCISVYPVSNDGAASHYLVIEYKPVVL